MLARGGVCVTRGMQLFIPPRPPLRMLKRKSTCKLTHIASDGDGGGGSSEAGGGKTKESSPDRCPSKGTKRGVVTRRRHSCGPKGIVPPSSYCTRRAAAARGEKCPRPGMRRFGRRPLPRLAVRRLLPLSGLPRFGPRTLPTTAGTCHGRVVIAGEAQTFEHGQGRAGGFVAGRPQCPRGGFTRPRVYVFFVY